MTLNRKLMIAVIAGLLFGAAMVFFTSPNPTVQAARSKAIQALNTETVGHPAPAKRQLAMVAEEPPIPKETPPFSCLSYLHDQIEDYDLFLKRLERELNPLVGSWYFYHDEDLSKVEETSASGLFLLGLAEAGLLDGSPAPPDNPRAIENLKRAHKLDPKNSAPLIFLAYLADQRDDPATAEKYRAQIASTSRFDSYILSIANALYNTIESPSDYMNVTQVWSATSIPNYTVLGKYLKEHQLPAVADQMIAAQDLDGEPDLDYFFIEGAVGVATIKSLQPERAPSLPNLKEVMHKLISSRPAIIWDEMDESGCELSRLEPDIARLHERRRKQN